MTEKITNGDYVKNGASLAEIEHIEEVLQNIAIALKTQRGSFYPDKNYGSALFNAGKETDEAYAAAYARQALYNLSGVLIKSVKIYNSNFEFTIAVNNQERQVLVTA